MLTVHRWGNSSRDYTFSMTHITRILYISVIYGFMHVMMLD